MGVRLFCTPVFGNSLCFREVLIILVKRCINKIEKLKMAALFYT